MTTSPDLPGDLLALAREDLASAEALDRDERVSDSPVGFHAQQAVEKPLKAVIVSRGLEFPFTHDIGLLMQLCEDAGFELPAMLQTKPFAIDEMATTKAWTHLSL